MAVCRERETTASSARDMTGLALRRTKGGVEILEVLAPDKPSCLSLQDYGTNLVASG
jgi:hypothetical protein